MRNRRSTKLTAADFAIIDRTGMMIETYRWRLKQGWSRERIEATPIQERSQDVKRVAADLGVSVGAVRHRLARGETLSGIAASGPKVVNREVPTLCRETGVGETTVRRWLKQGLSLEACWAKAARRKGLPAKPVQLDLFNWTMPPTDTIAR